MANSTTNLNTASETQAGKMTTLNGLFDAGSNALTFGRRADGATYGLTWAMYGGVVRVSGTPTRLANCTVTLSSGATNYVEFDPTNTGTNSGVSKNTTAFTAGRVRLYTVEVDGGGATISYTDHRIGPSELANPRIAYSMSSDANKTLTDVQAAADILDITSAVSLGATRDIIVPLNPKQWTVYNGTTGAQSIRFIGASGTGITVANGKRAIVYADGTNIVRVTADT
jgi:hypothetical protein